jgi:hypothetical protein
MVRHLLAAAVLGMALSACTGTAATPPAGPTHQSLPPTATAAPGTTGAPVEPAALALTGRDVGRTFMASGSVVHPGRVRMDFQALAPTLQTLTITIEDAGSRTLTSADVQGAIDGFIADVPSASPSGTRQPVTPPAIDENTRRTRITGQSAQRTVTGDIIAWTSGRYLVLVAHISEQAADAEAYAKLQQAKITEMSLNPPAGYGRWHSADQRFAHWGGSGV